MHWQAVPWDMKCGNGDSGGGGHWCSFGMGAKCMEGGKGGKLTHRSVDDDEEDRTANEAKQAVRLNLADANTILNSTALWTTR